MYDLILKNALVALDKNNEIRFEQTDIAVTNGKIAKIGALDSASSKETRDLAGMHILPGLIDTQVHFRDPGLTHKEDLHTGSKSAVLGGVTGFFEMPNTIPLTINVEEFNKKIQRASEVSYCDFSFFIGASASNIKELPELQNLEGCCGIKIFMGSSTGNLLINNKKQLEEIFATTQRTIALHCEDEDILIENMKKHKEEDVSVSDHPVIRNVNAAITATKTAVELSKKLDRNIHILHISSKDEVEFLLENKTPYITVEVTPQHLSLSAPQCYEELGSYAQMNPPIRSKDHTEAIWKGLNNGLFDILGSDHAPHLKEEKDRKYPKTPSGMPGVQTIIPIMLDHINKGGFSLERLVQMMSSFPAKRFGIKNKGQIKEGFDADFTVVNMKKEVTLTHEMMASKCGWTPYNGKNIQGFPIMTIIRGNIIMDNGEVLGEPSGQSISFNKL
ncbi:MAG: dihydroorotase [Bdellovibrionaceae bacterium]|nr:dihydroorotase [Pseudobdellovibrionaceae bacterium]